MRRWSSFLGSLTFVLFVAWGGAAGAARPVRVALLLDGPSDADQAGVIAAQIKEMAAGERAFDLSITPPNGRAADGTLAGVRRTLDELLADKNVELVVATGAIGSQEVLRRKELTKPVVAAKVVHTSLPTSAGSGLKNLSFVIDPSVHGRELEALKALGSPKRIGIVVGKQTLEASEGWAAALVAKAKGLGLDAQVIPVEANGAAAITGVDAVYLAQIDELSRPAFEALVQKINAQKLRSLSARGRPDVAAGVLAAIAGPGDVLQRARRIGINVLRIAGGEAAASIAVAYQREDALVINLSTAQVIGWEPSYAQLGEAETIGSAAGPVNQGATVSLKTVVEGVLANNLDLAANLHEVTSAAESVEKAFSLMLPKISISGRIEAIDPKRAQASFGFQPQILGTAVVEANGILYSDKLFANLSIEEHVQHAREGQREAMKLDLILEASKAYLGVLQATVLERVRIENAKKTKANFAQAKVRNSVGNAGPTELLRWESQLALDQRDVLKAKSLRGLASMQLNRLMHRPQEEPLALANESKDQALINLAPEKLAPFIETEQRFAAFREVLVQEGLKGAPELAALDSAVEAAERASSAAWRTVFVPTIGYGGQVAYRYLQSGKGSGPPELPADLPTEQRLIFEQILPPPIGNITYQIGGFISLPLPLDLDAFADIRKADAELARRQAERSSAKEKIEQRIRSAAIAVAASYPGVSLANISAEAARKNFAIAQDAYATGALGVLDLIDAQNLSLVAEQLAVGAQYEFMSDQLDLERALGGFVFLKTEEEKNEWLQRLSTSLGQR